MREREQFAALRTQIAHAKTNAPGFGRLFADVDPADIRTPKELAQLPVTRKSELPALQKRLFYQYPVINSPMDLFLILDKKEWNGNYL